MPLDVVPMNDPLSSVTIGEATSKLANTKGITAHRARREDLREAILADEMLRGQDIYVAITCPHDPRI
jgi:hypothetical protein